MTDDLLTALRPDDALDHGAPVRDVADIRRRARTLRARRRLRVGATSATGIAAALAVLGVVLPQGTGDPTTPSAATYLGVTAAHAADGGEGDCSVGFGTNIAPADVADHPDVAALAVLVRDGVGIAPLRGVKGHLDEGPCLPPVPALVLHDPSASRGISVWPDVANPYDGEAGLVTTQVRGTEGRLMTLETGTHVLTWVEPGGERWLAEASGVEVDTLVTVLDGMQVADDGAVTVEPPDGLTSAPLAAPPTDAVTSSWTVQYGSPGAEWTADRVVVSVSEAYWPTAVLTSQWSGYTVTEVDGRLAVHSAEDGISGTLQWDRDGRRYTVTAAADLERLVELAEQLEPVEVDDPRVLTAPDLTEVADLGR